MLIQAHPTLFRSFLIAHEEHLGQIQCHKVAGTVTRTVREGFLERDRGGEQRATRRGWVCGAQKDRLWSWPWEIQSLAPPLASCVTRFLICERGR